MAERTTHTPGPWGWFDDELHNVAAYEGFRRAFDAARDSNGDVVMADVAIQSEPIVETDGGHLGPYGADRDLIAAAPELLAACKAFVETHHGWHLGAGRCVCAAHEAALAAIAKAEGRS